MKVLLLVSLLAMTDKVVPGNSSRDSRPQHFVFLFSFFEGVGVLYFRCSSKMAKVKNCCR